MLTNLAAKEEVVHHVADDGAWAPDAHGRPRSNRRLLDFCEGHNGRVRREPLNFASPRHRADEDLPAIGIWPKGAVTHRRVSWRGMAADLVEVGGQKKVEFRFRAPVHLLAFYVQGARRQGETYVEGLPQSTLKDFTQKVTFVPAGHEFHDVHEPRGPLCLMFFYIDPATLNRSSGQSADRSALTPRLFLDDATMRDTALKLKRLMESAESEDHCYMEAVGAVLMHEIIRLGRRAQSVKSFTRGGLAAWQTRVVTEYIDENLSESIPLSALAELVHLSPYHFCRTFKQSFGIPPHRYHMSRRIERAKAMLTEQDRSVTDIGLTVGFSETSSFTAAFRKVTGQTPTSYRRSLV